MHARKKSTVLLFCLITFIFGGIFTLNVYPQAVTPVSVEGETVFSDYFIPSKPSRYTLNEVLKSNEKHILDSLTSKERQRIEAEVNPPAIGVVRDLKNPIHFSLKNIEIPSEGEISVSGGRFKRINDDLYVWTTCIRSAGADKLRILFSEGNIPEGVQINLFGKDKYAFTQKELRGQINEYGFYSTSMFGDYAFIQVVIPEESLDNNLYFIILQVVHSEKRYFNLDALPLSCYEDANCSYASTFTHINKLRQSTARLEFVKDGVNYVCSGALLADHRYVDKQPYLLTANHCFNTQASANSLEAYFDYITTYCGGPLNPGVITINGANLLWSNSQTDFTLVLLKDNPGGTRSYLGWTTGGVSAGEVLHSTNHPKADPSMKYAKFSIPSIPGYPCMSQTNFHFTSTLGGQTSGGSSGGPIVNSNGSVVGQLWGKCYFFLPDECVYSSFNSTWGKFSVSYSNNNLQYWLLNSATAQMIVSPSSLTFSNTIVGNWEYKTVTIFNSGTVPFHLNLEAGNVTISGTHASQFWISGPTSLYLPPSTSGTFTVRFVPNSAGTKTATLNIPHNANNFSSPKTISLTGLGIPDPCDNIITIGGCGSLYSKTTSLGGTGLWFTSTNTPCGYQCPGLEHVYEFTAPYTGTYSIEVTIASGYVDYMWKDASGGCSSSGWTCIDNVATIGTKGSMSWTSGTTYYILLDDENSTAGTHQFYINCPVICKTCPSHDYEISSTTSWQTHPSYLPYDYACKFYRIYVKSGFTYQFKTGCGDGATANFNTYLWLYNSACSYITANNDGCESGRSIIDWTADYKGYAYLKVRGYADANGTYTLAYRQCTKPAQPGTISGPTPVCAGAVHMYFIPSVSGATSYTWTLPAGWSGSSTSTFIFATASMSSGTISVIANNDCGSSPARTKTVSVTNIPAQPGTISGPTPVCQGWSSAIYSISSVSGATSYTWTLPGGWSGSSTSTVIIATAGSSGGTISVTANNSCGASGKRYKSVSVIPALSIPGPISGPSPVNQGSTHTYSVSPVSGATSYTWTLPASWSGSSSTTSISATAGASGGNIYVRAVNSCFNSPWRSKAVTVVPTNTSVTNVVITSGQSECYDALQTIWVAGGGNNFIVQNGGSATMIAGQNIFYYPGTTVYAGGYLHGYIAPSGPWCGSGSLIPQTIPNRETEDSDRTIASRSKEGQSFKIYPNPTTGNFTLELTGLDEIQPVTVMVYSMQGNKVLSIILEGKKKYDLSLSGKPTGLYFVRIVTEGIAETVKIVKL